jgi:N-acetylglutamate synthase-like GNAT family acetyltransferase
VYRINSLKNVELDLSSKYMYTASNPVSKFDFDAYYALRFEVLRKPWNQPLGSEKDEMEETSTHAFIKHENEVIAVCRLQLNTPSIGQLRYMAVKESMQGNGLGKIIIAFLETEAKNMGAQEMVLHARENAVDFYKSCGYSVIEKSYLMWGEIQHYLMHKQL